MSLLLLFRQGGGTAVSGSTVVVVAIHKHVGVLQPDVLVAGGGHGTA